MRPSDETWSSLAKASVNAAAAKRSDPFSSSAAAAASDPFATKNANFHKLPPNKTLQKSETVANVPHAAVGGGGAKKKSVASSLSRSVKYANQSLFSFHSPFLDNCYSENGAVD